MLWENAGAGACADAGLWGVALDVQLSLLAAPPIALACVRAFKGNRRAWRDEVRVLASGAALGLSVGLGLRLGLRPSHRRGRGHGSGHGHGRSRKKF